MIRALIPAAGKGTRSGLDFPKTLQQVDGTPILVRIIRALTPVTSDFTVIVSPDGRGAIADTLGDYKLDAELIEQDSPLGMGDAVSRFASSPAFQDTDEIILVWGDMIAVPTLLVETVLGRFRRDGSDFAFPTHYRSPCYTHTRRDAGGAVTDLIERREEPDTLPEDGEADCGLFIFRKAPVFKVLTTDRETLTGKTTGEIGFLAVVGVLARNGYRVDAYPIARDIDAASFNSPDDLTAYRKIASRTKTMPTMPNSASEKGSTEC